MSSRISQLSEATGWDTSEKDDLLVISRPESAYSATFTIYGADNSINDAAGQFIVNGFAVGQQIRLTGLALSANNLFSAKITALTANKMTIGGTDGDPLSDEVSSPGTVERWKSRRVGLPMFASGLTQVAVLAPHVGSVTLTPECEALWAENSTVVLSGSDISAVNSDNSFNQASGGVIAAGIKIGDTLGISGFSTGVNNLHSFIVKDITPNKIYVQQPEGGQILDEAAGNAITITRWRNRRSTLDELTTYFNSNLTLDAADVGFVPATNANWTPSSDPGNVDDALDQLAARVKATETDISGIANAQVYKGVIDCSADPNYPAADAGDTYRISVAGKIGGASGPNVEVSDMLVCILDGSAAGNHATVGANWNILQGNIDGAVVGPTSATDSHFAQFDGTTGKLLKGGLSLDTSTTLSANSDTRVASQKAVKAYVDAAIPATPAKVLVVACSDETTALTAGTAKVTFRMPYAMTVTAVRASLTTAQAGGSIFTVDINEGGASILGTKLTIDNTEKTSTTAVAAATITDSDLADDAEITVDIDQIGDGSAKGLKIYLIGS